MSECERCGGSGVIEDSAGPPGTRGALITFHKPCPDCMVPREGMWEKKRVEDALDRAYGRTKKEGLGPFEALAVVNEELQQEFAENKP